MEANAAESDDASSPPLTEEERLKIAEQLDTLPPYMSELAGMTPHKLAVITMHTCLSTHILITR